MTGLMKPMSRWASRNGPVAIALVIGCEIANAFCGLLLGSNGLADLSGTELAVLGVVVLVGMVMLHRPARLFGTMPYAVQRYRLMGLFGRNVLLFALLGGFWTHTTRTPSTGWTVQGGRRVVVRADTLVKPTNTRQKPVIVRDADGYIISRSRVGQDSPQSEQERNRRFGFVMLFIAGFALTYISAGLACSIACSGYGALAVLTFALGLGFMAGGVYFLGRATERPFVPLPEQPLAQRRRTIRRFWLSWLVLISVFGVSLLTCNR